MERLPIPDSGSLPQLTACVEQALAGQEDLARDFDACLVEVRRQTLSLGLIERELDEHFHAQQKVQASLEEIKNLLVHSPLLGEWTAFRKARPEAVRSLVEADEHFLAGRKEQGAALLLELLRQRGVGEVTLAHQLGLVELGRGQLKEANERLKQATQAGPAPASLMVSCASLSTLSGRDGLACWRSLPRGFRVGRKYRIEAEVGRGGMASVYRAERLASFEQERTVALKVSAPALMQDPVTRHRFEQEIAVSRRLSEGRHPHIVRVLDYEIFDDPFSQQELYALVLEFVEGTSLAGYLTRRREANKPLGIDEVRNILEGVCAALEHAHGQGVFHRDLKPANVLVAKGPVIKLTDFGIARVLDDSRDSLTKMGQVVGTLAYLPPELLTGTGAVDARTDVYMLGTLLVELLTFDPSGDPEGRIDIAPGWLDLIDDSRHARRNRRPESVTAFRERLRQPMASSVPVSSDRASAPT